jgi:alpha/beta superfamily hydrolase
MNASTRSFTIPGPVGPIEVALDLPAGPASGVAVIAHPHPLYGGTRDNKVVQTVARALRATGRACWRPNFRGVGETAGEWDEGRGETEDLLAVVQAALAHDSAASAAPGSLILAGFSFGSFVQSRVAARLREQGRPPKRMILVGTAASRFTVESVPPDSVVIHGELDDTVPLQAVFDWARPLDVPVIVIPGADHFFHRRLPVIKRLVIEAIGRPAEDDAED